MLTEDSGVPLDELTALARALELNGASPILAIRRASGHPVYLVDSERIAPGEAQYLWTNTNLAVLEVAAPLTDASKHKCLALLYLLEAHALGLPLMANLAQPYEGALEACALVRGRDSYMRDQQPGEFMPLIPEPLQRLSSAVLAGRSVLRGVLGYRLSALLIEAGFFPRLTREIGGLVREIFPGLEEVTRVLRNAAPLDAINAVMSWIGVPRPKYAFRRDRSVQVARPRVHPLTAVFAGVISTTEHNRKNFNLELEHLRFQMNAQWTRPYVGLDHDRTLPPTAIVLGTHISRRENADPEVFELHARIGALSERGRAALVQKPGMSISFREGPRDD